MVLHGFLFAIVDGMGMWLVGRVRERRWDLGGASLSVPLFGVVCAGDFWRRKPSAGWLLRCVDLKTHPCLKRRGSRSVQREAVWCFGMVRPEHGLLIGTR